jgi:hypothetical protein
MHDPDFPTARKENSNMSPEIFALTEEEAGRDLAENLRPLIDFWKNDSICFSGNHKKNLRNLRNLWIS